MILLAVMLVMAPAEGVWCHEEPGDGGPETGGGAGWLLPLRMFQETISGVDGDRCSLAPSCSQYAVEAFHRHGVVFGWIMTSDRLMRCGRDELQHAESITVDGVVLGLDPVDNNDFWLPDSGMSLQDDHGPDSP
ncbi:MAG: membrane protein insertion efficiency factor YidD [Thermodesulfobacteriota bacterium]